MNTPGYTAAEVAAGMLRVGIARLAEKYPFHSRVLERFRPRADPAVGTMGVGLRDDRLELVFSPDFVARITADELGGVLVHEVLHVVLGHVTADRDRFPDREARTIAEEVTVNEFVREPLPGQPIVLAIFPNLPPGESTAERYRRLAGRVPEKWSARLSAAPGSGTQTSPGQGNGGSAGSGGDGEGNGDGTSGASADGSALNNANPRGNSGAGVVQPVGQASRRDRRPAAGGNAGRDGTVAGGNARHPAGPRPPLPGLVDNHSGWPSTAGQREVFRSVLADLITDVAADTPVPAEIAESLRGCGVVPGRGRSVVRGETPGGLDWRTLLRRYVGRELKVEPRYSRPPRRFPALAGVVPGRGRAEGEVSVAAVIDTSASMTAAMLEAVAGELRHLGRKHPVHVVESDCAVRRSYRFRGRLGNVVGRGGTDFRPPLERAFLRRLRPTVVVVFTDGHGPAPDRQPAVPVIWCLTPGGRRPADWGRVVEMGTDVGTAEPEGKGRSGP